MTYFCVPHKKAYVIFIFADFAVEKLAADLWGIVTGCLSRVCHLFLHSCVCLSDGNCGCLSDPSNLCLN